MAVAFCQQRRMGAALNDLPIVKHQNFVGVLHSGKAVGRISSRVASGRAARIFSSRVSLKSFVF